MVWRVSAVAIDRMAGRLHPEGRNAVEELQLAGGLLCGSVRNELTWLMREGYVNPIPPRKPDTARA